MSDLNHCQLINSRIQELNLSRREIVDRKGYENINKGYRVLDEVRKGELIRGGQIELFATALKIENESLKKAMKKTEEEIRDFKYEIRKKNFKPFLCSIGKKKCPSPIFAAILSDNQRYVFYDDEFLEQEEGKKLEK